MTSHSFFTKVSHCRNIFIVESLASWPYFHDRYDSSLDIVLTYDFALRKQIENIGGKAFYVDHLCDPDYMQVNNFLTYSFFLGGIVTHTVTTFLVP